MNETISDIIPDHQLPLIPPEVRRSFSLFESLRILFMKFLAIIFNNEMKKF